MRPAVRKFLRDMEAIGEAKGEAIGEARGKAIGEAMGKAIGEARGKAIGEARGKAIGEARGKAIGEAKGRQDALLTLLAARGLAVSAANRARIKACDKPATLDRWITRAATAPSVTAVLGPARRRPAARKKPVTQR
jgi:hypothetical protein